MQGPLIFTQKSLNIPNLARLKLRKQKRRHSMTKQADFRKYYRDAHATNLLTDREKKLIGIAVAIVRNCQP